MGSRLAGWRTLTWKDRRRLVGCIAGLTTVHAVLALAGYSRTRSLIEALTRGKGKRPASRTDIEAAQSFARLASIAGRHGMVEATCLRQSLLLYGCLRQRGLSPSLHLGLKRHDGPFHAHAWVELEGTPLLPADAGHHAFFKPS